MDPSPHFQFLKHPNKGKEYTLLFYSSPLPPTLIISHPQTSKHSVTTAKHPKGNSLSSGPILKFQTLALKSTFTKENHVQDLIYFLHVSKSTYTEKKIMFKRQSYRNIADFR